MHIDTVRAAYRRYAGVYDLVFGKSFEAGRQQTLDSINRRRGLRVLEVGVGTGLSLPDYHPDNTIVGIDGSSIIGVSSIDPPNPQDTFTANGWLYVE